jgi:peptidoglycan/LPS O-acetylase OafA/YrhL
MIDAINLHFQLTTSVGWRSSLLESLHFATMFWAGALLARHRKSAVEWFGRRTGAQRGGLWVLAFFAVVYGRAVMIVPTEAMRPLGDIAMTLGVIVVIQTALSVPRFANALKHPWLVVCGRYSYSLYLWHVVVLLSVFHLLADSLAVGWLVVLTLIGSVIATAASFVWIETPSITWGRKAASWWTGRIRPKPPAC